MRALRNYRFALTFLFTFTVSAISLGAEPHSWCNTGDALIKGGADADTNKIIGNVCDGDFAYCCSDGPTGAEDKELRWDLTCVQKAATYAHAKKLVDGGDHCGRYGWAQGPIRRNDDTEQRNFKQRFPRDFNIVALSGDLGYLRDIEGPVAASGNVEIAYFNLNYGRKDEVALLAGGKVKLYSGTVSGSVQYGTTYRGDATVTYNDGAQPTAPISPALIDFGQAQDDLVGVSEAIRDNYDVNGSASKMWGTVTLTGNDPELNVFQLNASQGANTNTYVFKVPAGSAAIVTVLGASPAFKYAGFQDAPEAKKLLWSFPEATSLTVDSVGFIGSILAPKAAASLQNGSIKGTVVVASAARADVELYSAPFELGCRGGLCLDKTWSCSNDTVMADDGTAADVASEAGFLEIDGGDYYSEGQQRYSPKHRVWYSFHPAKFGRKNKPLAVFFQGGPGGGTTPILFAFGTGPKTFKIIPDPSSPTKAGTLADLVSNPNSWTEFANLLYIDAPATGFSYPLKGSDGSTPDIGNDIDRDASNFLRVLTRFLLRHPALQTNRVILVGESYGGVRATMMLQYLYSAAGVSFADTNAYVDDALSGDLATYFKSAFGTKKGDKPTVPQIAQQFGHQVLIEPNVVGGDQQAAMSTYNNEFSNSISCKKDSAVNVPCWMTVPPKGSTPRVDPTCDSFNCDKDVGWSDTLQMEALAKLTSVKTLNAALNVDSTSIAWMYADARKDAYGRATVDVSYVDNGSIKVRKAEVEAATPIDMAKAVSSGGFGALNDDDNYLVLLNGRVRTTYGTVYDNPAPVGAQTARFYTDLEMGAILGSAFARHLHNGVKSFITVAQHDSVIWTPGIARAFESLLSNPGSISVSPYPLSAEYAAKSSGGIPGRGGVLEILLSTGSVDVAMPSYDSGHSVTMRAPEVLRSDVMSWCKDDVMTWYKD